MCEVTQIKPGSGVRNRNINNKEKKRNHSGKKTGFLFPVRKDPGTNDKIISCSL